MFKKALIIVLIFMAMAPVFAEETAVSIGSPPPALELSSLSGKKVSLEPYLGSQTIVLSFFASWSKSCRQEIEFLQSLKGVKVIGISFDRKQNELKSFISDSNVDFDILYDKKLTSLKDFEITILPTLFVIGKDGNIGSIYVDFDDNVKEAVKQEIEKFLAPPK